MIREDVFARLPDEAIRELEPELGRLLKEGYDRLGPGQAFIQFVDDVRSKNKSVSFQSPREGLWIPEEGLKVEALLPNTANSSPIGLTRWAAVNNKTITYPADSQAADHYIKVDSRVQTEIVGPIHFRGKVTGIVLFDGIHDERRYGEDDKVVVEELLHQIDLKILEIERREDEDYAAGNLKKIINYCYDATLSTRGYIAVKRWDGLLEYFTVGDKKEVFLDLAPHEGLCGEVFRTGVLVNPETSLFGKSNYIPSDNDIQSEIVCPIKLNDTTIGVINLESYLPNAYDEKAENILQSEAEKAAKHALFYRKPPDPDFGFAIADLFQTSLWVRPPTSSVELEENIRAALERWSLGLLKGRKCEFWLNKNAPAPRLLRGVAWEEAARGTPAPSSSGSGKVLYAPVLLQGDPIFVIAVELKGQSKIQNQNTLKALCRIASEAFRRARYEYRVRSFIKLVELLISREKETVIERSVHEIPFILQSNHCTLFYLLEYKGRKLFVPGPSTAADIHFKGQNPGYSPSVEDGLTGFVAESGESLHIHDVRDADELREINRKLVWKSNISEEIEWDCRSFLACPITDPLNNTRVIGVLRTHRDAKSHRSGFTDEDVGMFKTIAHLLRHPLSGLLEKKSWHLPLKAETIVEK